MPPRTRLVLQDDPIAAAAREAVRRDSLAQLGSRAGMPPAEPAPPIATPTPMVSGANQARERVLPKFSMNPEHFAAIERSQARFRVASGGKDCGQSRAVIAAILLLDELSDQRLVEVIGRVETKKPGPRKRLG